jgi:hypothetical protein
MESRRTALALAALLLVPAPSHAFAAAGTSVAATSLPGVSSPKEDLLPKGASAAVLLFFRAGQDRSRDALREIGVAQSQLAGKPVRWLGIVPEGTEASEVSAILADAKASLPVARDAGDALYAALGLSLHPVVVVLGQGRKVVAIETYRLGRFSSVLTALTHKALGEGSDAEVAAAEEPETSLLPGADPVLVGMRHVKLGRKLLAAGITAKAHENAKKALAIAPSSAAWALEGEAFVAEKRCPEALKAFASALAMDPRDPAALAGRARCAQ